MRYEELTQFEEKFFTADCETLSAAQLQEK